MNHPQRETTVTVVAQWLLLSLLVCYGAVIHFGIGPAPTSGATD